MQKNDEFYTYLIEQKEIDNTKEPIFDQDHRLFLFEVDRRTIMCSLIYISDAPVKEAFLELWGNGTLEFQTVRCYANLKILQREINYQNSTTIFKYL